MGKDIHEMAIQMTHSKGTYSDEWSNVTKNEYWALFETLNEEQQKLLDKLMFKKKEFFKRCLKINGINPFEKVRV